MIKGWVAEVAREITQLPCMDIFPSISLEQIAVLGKMETRKLPILLLMLQLPQHKKIQTEKSSACALF